MHVRTCGHNLRPVSVPTGSDIRGYADILYRFLSWRTKALLSFSLTSMQASQCSNKQIGAAGSKQASASASWRRSNKRADASKRMPAGERVQRRASPATEPAAASERTAVSQHGNGAGMRSD